MITTSQLANPEEITMTMPRRPAKRITLMLLLTAVCALAPSLSMRGDEGEEAVPEAGPEDGILCCNGVERFLFHGDQVLVTTGRAGIFRSEHRGVGWQRSMQGLVASNGVSPFVGFLCQSPSDTRVVYALAGGGPPLSPFDGLFSSGDFGETWTRGAPVLTSRGFGICDVDPDDARTVYVKAFNPDDNFNFELWKSTDGGRTIRQVVLPFPPSDLSDATVARGTLYALDAIHGLFASSDGGLTFQHMASPSGPGLPGGVQVSPDGRLIFATRFDPQTFHTLATYRSSDGGISYAEVEGLPEGPGILQFDPTAPARVYTNPDRLVRVSTDGGLTFSPVPASEDPRFLGGVGEIAVDDRGSIYLSTRGGPFRTDDGFETFYSLLKDFRASSVQDVAFDADGELLVAVLHTQVVFRQLRGRAFRPIGTALMDRSPGAPDLNAAAVAGSPVDTNVVLVALVGGGLVRTNDGGREWTSPTVPGSPGFYSNARMAFPTASRVYIASPGGDARGLYRSDDAGQTFARLSSKRFGAIAVDSNNPDIVYVGDYVGGSGLFKSTDGGQTIQDLGQPGTFSALAVDRDDANVIYAGERFGQVLRSRDGGRTFVPASDGLAGAGVHGLAQDAHGTLFVWIRGGGLFSSNDGACTWSPVDTDEALRRSGVEAGRGTLVADPRHPGRVYLANGGVIRIDADDRDQ